MSDDQVTRMLVFLRKQRDAAEAQCDALTAERDLLAATLARYREFVAAHDAVEHLIADHTDDRDAYNAAVTRANAARAALPEEP